jgi:predicted transcriptional regulator
MKSCFGSARPLQALISNKHIPGENLSKTHFPEISQLKKIRNQLGMTQTSLSKRSGIAQSTITKIERGSIKGSYPDVVKLFETLDEEMDKKRQHVPLKDISTKSVISVFSTDPVRKASELMHEKNISQIPVFRGDVLVGSVSESDILQLIMSGVPSEEAARRPIESIMESPFPMVDESVERESVERLILKEHAILTTKNGKITGIVTSADLIQIGRSPISTPEYFI